MMHVETWEAKCPVCGAEALGVLEEDLLGQAWWIDCPVCIDRYEHAGRGVWKALKLRLVENVDKTVSWAEVEWIEGHGWHWTEKKWWPFLDVERAEEFARNANVKAKAEIVASWK